MFSPQEFYCCSDMFYIFAHGRISCVSLLAAHHDTFFPDLSFSSEMQFLVYFSAIVVLFLWYKIYFNALV